ncbi:hypothetical protein [Syntrophomonas curvata]
MTRKRKRPVNVSSPEEKKTIINPNRIKVRDMRGILLGGCGYHKDRKKLQNKYACRRPERDED